ncbi:MAG TPA: ATP-dependent DNA helicase, partial [Candidatus Paceibacterota bacterium]
PWGEPLYYIKDIYKKIEELKREAVGVEEFTKIASLEEKSFKNRSDLYYEKGAYKGKMKGEHRDFERIILKNIELASIYAEYQKNLKERRLYDFSDMIVEVVNAMKKHSDLKLSLQENNQYILVDEHQDTNNAQNKILESILDFHQSPNIFIVGDEKQAIFRFQGASLQNFEYMKKLYPNSEIISLDTNYRSGQNILDAAHSLISSQKLTSGDKNKNSSIKVMDFSSRVFEINFIAEHIKELLSKKVPPKEIAVIYRSNREAFPISEALERLSVPYTIESDEDLLNEKFVKKILTVLEAIYNFGKDEFLIPLLHISEFEIEPLKAYRLIHEAGKTRTPLYDLIRKSEEESMSKLNTNLSNWVKNSNSDHLSEFLERVLRESGLLASMISSRDAEAFLGIEKLLEEGKRISSLRPGASLTDFMEFISVVKKRNLFIKRPKQNGKNAVRLMTAHRSKGLEFDHVFITNATENSFGEKKIRDSLKLLPKVYSLMDTKEIGDALADERRLFYVSLTRAKSGVVISYSTTDESGKDILPSPFILEIREDRKENISGKSFEEEFKKNPEKIFAERKRTGVVELDKDFVRELFHDHPLSVTALNNYLSCPWKYFYRNLLRIPSAPEKHQIYGIAMHGAVEDLWRSGKDRDLTKKFLLDSYERRLGLIGILTDREFKEALQRGKEALSGWFTWANPKITNPVLSEFNVKAVELERGVVLSGKLDRVEIISEKKFIVTDYKTGKQKSRNFIEGKTKDSTGDMKRQIVFYKLILSLYDDVNMEKGIIEFLEPSESGKYGREEFEVNTEEVDELKTLIKKVSGEIVNLDFWNKTCGDKDCEYCSYRKILDK